MRFVFNKKRWRKMKNYGLVQKKKKSERELNIEIHSIYVNESIN